MQALVDSTSGRPGKEETAAAAASRVPRARTTCSTRDPAMVAQTLAAQLETLTVKEETAAAAASRAPRARTACSTRGPAMVSQTLAAQLETLTVKELKNELRAKHMPVSGLKADLVARLMK